MREYTEKKAREIRDKFDMVLDRYFHNEDVQRIIVSDLKTDVDGDIYIQIYITYRERELFVGTYYIWMDSIGGWRDTTYQMARITIDTIKAMLAINKWWLYDADDELEGE